MQPTRQPVNSSLRRSLAADHDNQTYPPSVLLLHYTQILWPRLTPTCPTKISFPALHLPPRDVLQGWAVRASPLS